MDADSIRSLLSNPYFDLFRVKLRTGAVTYMILHRYGTRNSPIVDTDDCQVVLRHADFLNLWNMHRSADTVARHAVNYALTGNIDGWQWSLLALPGSQTLRGNDTTTNTPQNGVAA